MVSEYVRRTYECEHTHLLLYYYYCCCSFEISIMISASRIRLCEKTYLYIFLHVHAYVRGCIHTNVYAKYNIKKKIVIICLSFMHSHLLQALFAPTTYSDLQTPKGKIYANCNVFLFFLNKISFNVLCKCFRLTTFKQ